ncbi:MAG: class I SAM-dependent methyltransferase [Eudoraea sp.]|nr:class I SAM-dependent methyltransferase [Eudoraea sp.]
MSLKNVQKAYEKVGAEDPLWAILTDNKKRGNKWDPEEFFETGRNEINSVIAYLESIDVKINYGNAFDFGCGVGRLTQGLCYHFDKVTGVDISDSMIAGANRYNKFDKKCSYITNTEPNLKCLSSNTFDFVYTNIVLQHMAPRYQVEYIKEFFRILKPGGKALFQVRTPIGSSPKPGSLAEKIHNFRKERLKPFWKSIRGRPPIQVHTISPQIVEQIIAECGATILDVKVVDKRARRWHKNLRYCAKKPI